MPKIIGRKAEIQILDGLCQSQSAEFLAVYGRRRIGKTYLISNYFKNKGLYFELTGTKTATLSEQLKNFYQEFQRLFLNESSAQPKSWADAFFQLKLAIEKINNKQKIILFFDELPWLAAPKSRFLPALEYIWNRHFSRMNNLILIVCGSAASWMLHKIVNNKEGLYARLSVSLPLYPFDLKTIKEYLRLKHVLLNDRQITELYMCLGGVPKYFSYIKPGYSSVQSINELFFTPHGQLFLEFPKLFSSLFNNSKKHLKIVKILGEKRYGIYQKELLMAANLPQSGNTSTILEELEACGFIGILPMFGKLTHERKIRLIDEYSYFYLHWINPRRSSILNGQDQHYWESIFSSSKWNSWAGFSFESLCFKHIKQIKKKLGISGVCTNQSHWENEYAQIDLIIDRADHCINLIEIKFTQQEFVINKDYADKLRIKREAFRDETKTKKSLFITMLTPYGVKQNSYYQEMVQNQILLKDLIN